MCCLFGILDYGHKLSRKEKTKILSVLSVACEERGTEATGIAYNSGGSLKVYKRPCLHTCSGSRSTRIPISSWATPV